MAACNYQSSAVSIRIQNTSTYPSDVRAGAQGDLKATYAVLGVPSGTQIDLIEKREITHEGQIVVIPKLR